MTFKICIHFLLNSYFCSLPFHFRYLWHLLIDFFNLYSSILIALQCFLHEYTTVYLSFSYWGTYCPFFPTVISRTTENALGSFCIWAKPCPDWKCWSLIFWILSNCSPNPLFQFLLHQQCTKLPHCFISWSVFGITRHDFWYSDGWEIVYHFKDLLSPNTSEFQLLLVCVCHQIIAFGHYSEMIVYLGIQL